MTPAGRRVLVAAAFVGGLIGLAVFIGRTFEGTPAPPEAAPVINAARPSADTRAAPADPRRALVAALTPDDPEPPAADDPAAPVERPPIEPASETYRKLAVYPPDSRPLTAHSADLLDPNARHERPQTDPDDPTLTALFTADRYHLVGDDTLTVILDVRRDGEPAPVEIIDAAVRLPDGHPVPYTLRAQDGRYVGLIRPADYTLAAAARLDVSATFDYGKGPRTARLRAEYTPALAVPARFVADAHDALVDGSLVVTVPVDVEQAGLYLIDANLYTKDGDPLASSRFKEPLDEGRQTVALRFFGKILHDAARDGPYTVGELRGALAAPEHTPAQVLMPPYPGEITTAAYRAADFSAAEWDAPEKRERLRRLQRLEALGGAPRIGTPLPPAGGQP